MERSSSYYQPLPVTHSTPAPDAVARWIERTYDIGRVHDCRLLRAFTNDVYCLRADAGASIAKLFRRSWRSLEDAGWEAELQHEAEALGTSTPAIIAARSGELLAPVPAPEGTRWCMLQAKAEGEKPAKPFTADLYWRFGDTAGRIHAAFDRVSLPQPGRARTLNALLVAPLPVLEPLFSSLPADEWRFLINLATTIHAALDEAAPLLDWGICHGDLSLDNVVQTDSGGLVIYDFDLAAPSFRAADFFGVQMSQPDEHWQAFVAGYRAQRSISDRDINAVPWFVPAWTIWSMAHDAMHRVNWHGDWLVGPDQLANHLTTLRVWAERNL